MRLFAAPSPAISKALACVTTRWGAVALSAHSFSVFRSALLSSSAAAGLFIPAGILLGAPTVNIFQGHTTSFRPMRLRIGGLPRIPEKAIPPGPQPAQEAEP